MATFTVTVKVDYHYLMHKSKSELAYEVLRLMDQVDEARNAVKDQTSIPDRLQPLARLAQDMKDDDLAECLVFVAYLNHRRGVLHLAHNTFGSPLGGNAP